jgi:hypothetical protein
VLSGAVAGSNIEVVQGGGGVVGATGNGRGRGAKEEGGETEAERSLGEITG